ncbi:MAG TPA: class I SAM-dependent methyltransferase [Ruminococcus flavefaciens]|nr:class I SAM-dependent methyltransferase [Ruminococcus flavefaciens]HQM00271.1 class I SAM-dependent methyltransferase [Ruminococcus flavefaciens]
MSSNISKFLYDINNEKGIKGWLKRRIFGCILPAFEALDKDIGSSRVPLKENESDLRRDLETVSVNVRNNNALLERLDSETEFIKSKLSTLEKRAVSGGPAAKIVYQEKASAPVSDDYADIDYFDFENRFRGSIESVKKSQEAYLKYFRDKKHVLDIGCGRGEFLSLMKDNGINAEGVDIYEPYTDYCNSKGLKAHCGDGTAYLAKMKKTDGIFVGQVVEHMKTGEIIALCNTAYEKLEKGGCIIIETPNPTSLSIYTNAFYIDPSHIKPVHPLTLQYFLEKAGFTDVEIIYTEQSRPHHSIPELKISGGESEEFNKAMKKVSDMIFGSQDYAAVAIKK